MDGIIYHPNGEITIHFDLEDWKLGRPKLGTYRRFRERLADMRKAIFEANDQINVLRQQLADSDLDLLNPQLAAIKETGPDYPAEVLIEMERLTRLIFEAEQNPPDLEAIEEQIESLNAPVWEYSIPILADMIKTVADKPLPEDPDEWPAWLATSISIPTDIISHWHEVPKAPGSAGTN